MPRLSGYVLKKALLLVDREISKRIPRGLKYVAASLAELSVHREGWTNADIVVAVALLWRVLLPGGAEAVPARLGASPCCVPGPLAWDGATPLVPPYARLVTDAELMARLRYAGRIASAAYETDRRALEAAMGYRTADVIDARFEPDTGSLVPAYFVAVDHARRAVVVSVRGTWSWAEAVLNASAAPERFLGGTAHHGMLAAAEQLHARLAAAGADGGIFGALRRHPQYDLLCVGHSMGAAVAALLAMKLKATVPHARAACFSPPSCMSADLAASCAPYVTSFVHGDDVTPRFHVESTESLRLAVKQLDATAALWGLVDAGAFGWLPRRALLQAAAASTAASGAAAAMAQRLPEAPVWVAGWTRVAQRLLHVGALLSPLLRAFDWLLAHHQRRAGSTAVAASYVLTNDDAGEGAPSRPAQQPKQQQHQVKGVGAAPISATAATLDATRGLQIQTPQAARAAPRPGVVVPGVAAVGTYIFESLGAATHSVAALLPVSTALSQGRGGAAAPTAAEDATTASGGAKTYVDPESEAPFEPADAYGAEDERLSEVQCHFTVDVAGPTLASAVDARSASPAAPPRRKAVPPSGKPAFRADPPVGARVLEAAALESSGRSVGSPQDEDAASSSAGDSESLAAADELATREQMYAGLRYAVPGTIYYAAYREGEPRGQQKQQAVAGTGGAEYRGPALLRLLPLVNVSADPGKPEYAPAPPLPRRPRLAMAVAVAGAAPGEAPVPGDSAAALEAAPSSSACASRTKGPALPPLPSRYFNEMLLTPWMFSDHTLLTSLAALDQWRAHVAACAGGGAPVSGGAEGSRSTVAGIGSLR